MSILRLQRLTLAGLAEEKQDVLDHLQTLGCLHLVALRPAPKEPEKTPPQHAVDAQRALRYLADVPHKRRQVVTASEFQMQATVANVLDNQQRLRNVVDRRDTLAQRMKELEPWGDFVLPPKQAFAGLRLWFYIVPERQMKKLESLTLPWQVVQKDNRQSWVVVINDQEPAPDALPVPRAHTGALRLSEVAQRLEEAELELEEVEAERLALTRWIYQMASHLAQAEDQAGLDFANSQTLDLESLFLVQGWVAERDVAQVAEFARERGLAVLLEHPGLEDKPPTLLDNPEALAAGQDLVGFYQVPAYASWDPSRVLFFSFTAFFAMILSDAGYAVVLGVILGIYWRRLGTFDTGRRLRLLAAALVGGSLLWGVMVGSYFGFAPSPGSLGAHLKVLDINDFDNMMKLSVGLGVLHLVIANAEMALIGRGTAAGRTALGWIAAMIGGLLMWLGQAGGQTATGGQWLLAAGLVAVLLLGSDRPVTDLKSALLRLLGGLQALSNITKIFGDVLSYLRLFALGLASASLALTFNGLARQVAAEFEGLGLLFAILILLVGHLLNLLLGLMSGVVHGLRLNFIEFYNWALSGEGYPFKPFKKKELTQ